MKIFSCNIKDIPDCDLREWYNSMSSERKEAVRKLLVVQKQKLKIAADRICREAISEFCGISPDDITFSANEYGKPYAVGLDVNFSISHSGDYVICAVSENEIGADIEKIREIKPAVSKRFATESEMEYIASNPNGLFEIWTLKEACFKCIGTGLNGNIKNISFDIKENNIICSEEGYKCSFHNIAEGYICSVCEKR